MLYKITISLNIVLQVLQDNYNTKTRNSGGDEIYHEKRQLGKGSPEVSCIGFGAWPIGGGMGQVSENVTIEIVRNAIDQA